MERKDIVNPILDVVGTYYLNTWRDITILVLSLRVHAMIFVSAIVVAKVVV